MKTLRRTGTAAALFGVAHLATVPDVFPEPGCAPQETLAHAMTITHTKPAARYSTLTLSGVLAAALPHDLGTARGPASYTVPAVFSRRPEPRELDLLHHEDVGRRLADAGYSDVSLRVSDRRLLITNTNLQDLKSGLAHLIGTILADISRQASAERSNRAEELDALGRLEDQRVTAIQNLAAEIHFD